jgi:hypothetical protein
MECNRYASPRWLGRAATRTGRLGKDDSISYSARCGLVHETEAVALDAAVPVRPQLAFELLNRSWPLRLTTAVGRRSPNLRRIANMRPQQPIEDVLRRVRGEYIEMPGLRLTTAQAQRLWGLDRAACDALLGALVDAKFLLKTRDGAFVRSEDVRAAS